jgi:hypothetical protein
MYLLIALALAVATVPLFGGDSGAFGPTLPCALAASRPSHLVALLRVPGGENGVRTACTSPPTRSGWRSWSSTGACRAVDRLGVC